MTDLLQSPTFSVALTLSAFFLASKLYARVRFILFNPVLVSVAVLIVILKLLGLDYETYNRGGRLISFFLGPAVVALGLPLYEQVKEIRRRGLSIPIAILIGSVVGILSAAGLARWLGADPGVIASLAPKSVTTPIAIGIAENIGGAAPLTAGLVIATGVLGAVAGPWYLRLIRVNNPAAFGLAMGAASHGIGTARALEEGDLEGATAGLAIGLNGAATALLTPLLMKIFF